MKTYIKEWKEYMLMKWHNLTVEETLKELDASRSGLSDEKAKERLHQYGPNELTAKGKTPAVIVFLRQFASPLIFILLIAVLIKLIVMRQPTDAAVILTVLIINSIVGFIQESRAERAMEALKRLAVPYAKVLRQGAVTKISASHLVPGDVILLEAGDKVPVDARLIEAASLSVDESILTGESVPVEKCTGAIDGEATITDMGNMAHIDNKMVDPELIFCWSNCELLVSGMTRREPRGVGHGERKQNRTQSSVSIPV